MKRKKLFLITALPVFFLTAFLFLNRTTLKNFLSQKLDANPELKSKIKKYLLPYKVIDHLNYKIETGRYEILRTNIDKLSDNIVDSDLELKKSLADLKFIREDSIINFAGKKITLKKFKPSGKGLMRGIFFKVPGSAYLDDHNKNLILLSSTGILGYSERNDSELIFKQIKNNLNDYLGEKQLKKNNYFSVKDLLVFNDRIFVSFTNELKDNCWNTSILSAELDYKKVNFKPLFVPDECVHATDNPDKVFTAHQSGGRIIPFNKEEILFSTGDFRNRYLAQDLKSVMGKILKINLINEKVKLLSIGSRNIQGLSFDKKNNLIVFTEHGPRGGDEINILELNKLKNEVPNYGWAISSYGEHYDFPREGELGWSAEANDPYIKYPLHKSHKDFGFVEPIKYYVPSIGISEVTTLDAKNKKYIHSSLRGKSLYVFSLNKDNKLKSNTKVDIKERIRDILKIDNKLYLFLEDTASIGLIDLNQ